MGVFPFLSGVNVLPYKIYDGKEANEKCGSVGAVGLGAGWYIVYIRGV